jgi:sulfoxide reductase heme-binding subunit YedZ
VSWMAATPNPLWYVNRGTGAVTMLLLTGSVVLGIGTTVRWKSTFWPRYINAGLHRNVSLMFVCFLAIHVIAAILDPFAKLGLSDALVPFTSSYRPLWLGMGVVAAQVAVAMVLTSAIRGWIGYGVWRLIHWLSYVSWPLALFHGLGTGSDMHAWWFQWLEAACVLSVWVALISWRLSYAPSSRCAGGAAGLDAGRTSPAGLGAFCRNTSIAAQARVGAFPLSGPRFPAIGAHLAESRGVDSAIRAHLVVINDHGGRPRRQKSIDRRSGRCRPVPLCRVDHNRRTAYIP